MKVVLAVELMKVQLIISLYVVFESLITMDPPKYAILSSKRQFTI